MNDFSRYFPYLVIGGVAVWLAASARPPAADEGRMQIYAFGRLPVVDRGRIKPLDTYARTTLMVINDKQTFTDDEDDKYPAIQWFLELATTHPSDRFFRIDDPKLQALLGLRPRPEFGDRFQLRDFENRLRPFAEKVKEVREKKPADLDEADQAVLRLWADLYEEIALDVSDDSAAAHRLQVLRIENLEVLDLVGLEPRSGWRYSFAEIAPKLMALERRAEVAQAKPDKDRPKVDQKVLELYNQVTLYLAAARLQRLLMVPPPEGQTEWTTFREGVLAAVQSGDKDAPALKLREAFQAYRDKDAKGFNRAVAEYGAVLEQRFPHESSDARLEAWFNAYEPFYKCMILYVLIFGLVCVSWVGWTQTLNRTAFGLGLLTLGVLSCALILRMYLTGRPPVTNLYSSAVFIGWGCLGLCLVLEWIFKIGVGNLVGAVLGFFTMFLAQHLAGSGDTLEMMQAVLDTNFWLATHVVCITFGYVTVFVAGTFAIAYVICGVLTPVMNQAISKVFGQIIYGVICFAMLLSFVGTVLGGIWADQSWGRFWGWDPKENGALLIVIWCALILHARWAGLVKARGVALLAIGGNMVTMWSWFGTNQLQVGLHSYGFSNTLAMIVVAFWGVNALFLGLGLIPTRHWWSYAAMQGLTPPPAAPVLATDGPRVPPGPRLPRDKRRRR